MVTYAWKPGARINADPERVGPHLSALQEAQGGLTPDAVVADAADPDSPLHEAFEWDDAVAGAAYRLTQARYVLRSLVVSTESVNDGRPIRYFVNVEGEKDEPATYRPLEDVLSDAVLRRTVIARALKELDAWQRRYDEMVEFASLVSAIDMTRQELLPLVEAAEQATA